MTMNTREKTIKAINFFEDLMSKIGVPTMPASLRNLSFEDWLLQAVGDSDAEAVNWMLEHKAVSESAVNRALRESIVTCWKRETEEDKDEFEAAKEIFYALLDSGADPCADSYYSGNSYETSVHTAAMYGVNFALQEFIDICGKDKLAKLCDNEGRGVISLAVCDNNLVGTYMLLRALGGEAVRETDIFGRRPKDYAVCEGYKEMVELLEDYGAYAAAHPEIVREADNIKEHCRGRKNQEAGLGFER